MSGRNFSLTTHLSDFIDNEVTSGRHQNASEVVREALRRYENDVAAERASIAILEKISAEGAAAIGKGEFTPVGTQEQAEELLQRLNARASRAAKADSTRHG